VIIFGCRLAIAYGLSPRLTPTLNGPTGQSGDRAPTAREDRRPETRRRASHAATAPAAGPTTNTRDQRRQHAAATGTTPTTAGRTAGTDHRRHGPAHEATTETEPQPPTATGHRRPGARTAKSKQEQPQRTSHGQAATRTPQRTRATPPATWGAHPELSRRNARLS